MSTADQMELPLVIPRLVQCSAANPNDPNHHLVQHESGVWMMRITLDRGSKFVGKRRKISLRTKCVELARERRDRIVSELQRRGMLTSTAWARYPHADRLESAAKRSSLAAELLGDVPQPVEGFRKAKEEKSTHQG